MTQRRPNMQTVSTAAATMTASRNHYTVSELAREIGVDAGKILRWIGSGELAAVNIAERPTGRPRWRIPQAAWQAFALKRSNHSSAPSPAPRRRRKQANHRQWY